MDILWLFDRLRFLDWCALEDCARLGGANRALSLVAKTRLGCRRCPAWLRPFDEDGEGTLRGGLHVYALNIGMIGRADLGPEMFCPVCGAIHDFCGRCERPSTCLGHTGVAGRDDVTMASASIPGRGIDMASITFLDDDDEFEISILRPGGELVDKKCAFYVGDLGRPYAIRFERIGSRLMEFSLTGPNGGQPVFWRCVPCARTYGVTDK
ncbi:MAG: hypothetical protein V4537_14075 [Pseudomonadota bacterium]